jgi:hypothetical protein
MNHLPKSSGTPGSAILLKISSIMRGQTLTADKHTLIKSFSKSSTLIFDGTLDLAMNAIDGGTGDLTRATDP